MCSCVFFFKQKTAYEMRISDWSSDVCSSDLTYCITSSRRSCSKSTSMSGGSPRSSDTKREKSRSCCKGSTDVTPSRKQPIELADDPRPCHRIGGSRDRANRTKTRTVRQHHDPIFPASTEHSTSNLPLTQP